MEPAVEKKFAGFETLKVVKLVCPECRNANRKARRACSFCRGSGSVVKTVTKDELPDDMR